MYEEEDSIKEKKEGDTGGVAPETKQNKKRREGV